MSYGLAIALAQKYSFRPVSYLPVGRLFGVPMKNRCSHKLAHFPANRCHTSGRFAAARPYTNPSQKLSRCWATNSVRITLKIRSTADAISCRIVFMSASHHSSKSSLQIRSSSGNFWMTALVTSKGALASCRCFQRHRICPQINETDKNSCNCFANKRLGGEMLYAFPV
jgi:hypothetical protein